MTTIERDPELVALLDRLVPPTDERPCWHALAAAAERRRRARVLVLALAAVALAVAAPVAALAVTQGWWFFEHGAAPRPIGPVTVVARGSRGGVGWTLSAYRSATDGLCFGITSRATRGGALACDSIVGVPRPRAAQPGPPRALGFLIAQGDARLPAFVAGPVARAATRVEAILVGGRTITVRTFDAPSSLRADVRFYVVPLPTRSRVRALVARGPGRIVAYQPTAAAAAVPAADFGRMSNRGRLLRFSRAMRHRLRLRHRSTQIRLLATIGGQNVYLLGAPASKHLCIGVGRAVDPATLPPTRDGVAELGGYTCTERTPTTFPSLQHPIWDLSVYEASRAHPQMHVLRLAGVASDAVKSVALLDAHGRLVRRVEVVDNVYALPHVPPTVAIVAPADVLGRPIAFCGPDGGVLGIGSYVDASC